MADRVSSGLKGSKPSFATLESFMRLTVAAVGSFALSQVLITDGNLELVDGGVEYIIHVDKNKLDG